MRSIISIGVAGGKSDTARAKAPLGDCKTCIQVNIGIMMGNSNGFAIDTRASTDAAYHETCQGTYGGCLLRKLTTMDSSGKTSMTNSKLW